MTSRSPHQSEPQLIQYYSPQTDTPNKSGQENLTTRLDRVVQSLAERHSMLVISPDGLQLTNFLHQYAAIVSLASSYFQSLQEQELSVSIAAEWILDNNYILQHAIRQVSEDLPAVYNHQLPKLETTSGPGLPRVYLLAMAMLYNEKY